MKGIENFITFIEVAVFAKRDTFKKLTNIVILASIIGILIITIIIELNFTKPIIL